MNEHDSEAQQFDSCETYKFTTENQVYRYTSWESNLTIEGEIFQAVPIKRSGFTRNLMGTAITVNVQVPVASGFAAFIIALPVIPIEFELKKYYFDDFENGELVFKGDVLSLSVNEQRINAECVSSTSELDRELPRFICQSYCNNVFGDQLCGLDLSGIGFTNTITVEEIDNEDNSIIYNALFGSGAFGTDRLKLGRVIFNNDTRLILEQSPDDNSITLHSPFESLRKGNSIDVVVSCDKSYNQCLNYYNNMINFTGMPYVPKGTNPTIWGIE